MEDSVAVPVQQDYKSAVRPGQKVSVRMLRSKLDALEVLISHCADAVLEVQGELKAIIEEIGEEW